MVQAFRLAIDGQVLENTVPIVPNAAVPNAADPNAAVPDAKGVTTETVPIVPTPRPLTNPINPSTTSLGRQAAANQRTSSPCSSLLLLKGLLLPGFSHAFSSSLPLALPLGSTQLLAPYPPTLLGGHRVLQAALAAFANARRHLGGAGSGATP